MNTAATPGGATLRRALGRWDLTAIGINQVIGGAIFLMPSQVAGQVGNWSVIAFVLVGLASLLVALPITSPPLMRPIVEARSASEPVPLRICTIDAMGIGGCSAAEVRVTAGVRPY